MRRTLLAVAVTLLIAVPGSVAAAPKLFQGWTGTTDVVSNGGSLELSQGGSLLIDPGCANFEDNTAAPAHGVVVCNWGVRLIDYGPPVARADVLVGGSDPVTGGVGGGPCCAPGSLAGSLYLQHKPDDTGALWFRTGPNAADWTLVAGTP